ALACLFPAPFARGATVRKVDDTSATGTVTGLESGQVLLKTKGSDGKEQTTKIPLQDIVELSFKEEGRSGASGRAAPTTQPASGGATTRPASAGPTTGQSVTRIKSVRTAQGQVVTETLTVTPDGAP